VVAVTVLPIAAADTRAWQDLPPEAKARLRDRLAAELVVRRGLLPRPWRAKARPKQLPPDDPRHHLADENGYRCGCDGPDNGYSVWLVSAGRGLGKTLLGSNWLVEQALKSPGADLAAVAPTFRDVKKTCIEGSTGILAALQPGELVNYNKSALEVHVAGGATIFGYSADQPERLRGSNLSAAWTDEIGSWRRNEAWYEALIPALRIGRNPRVVATTTPRVVPLIRDLMTRDDGSVHLTTGSTWENAANLSAAALAELKRRYAGTRLGRQELEGQLLADIEGALWQRIDIEVTRVDAADVPELARVVVAIDPAVTSGEDADETGIVVVGEGRDQHGYVLADLTFRGSPDACMRRAVTAYHQFKGDCIVAEVNNGGDYVRDLLRTVDPNVPYRAVRASRGKRVRAEPVSALYEQHRVHHVGTFDQLEDQMCTWVPDSPLGSPDRVDALVWGMVELKGISAGSWLHAYGVAYCETCAQPFLPEDTGKCPFCGTPAPAEGDEDEPQDGDAAG
jgi:phage terminase large subunit-like protein